MYQDRLRQARYRSPGGAEFTLQFDDVSRSGSKKAAIHELPQQDKADIQDLGNNSDRFPMSVYFTGDDFDQTADAFFSALRERGPGSLQHPRYGDIPVLPLTWTQSESWTDGLGRADFKIEFIRVQTDVVFPITAVSATTAVANLADVATLEANLAAVAEFDPISAADISVIKDGISGFLADYQAAFAEIIAVSESIQAEVNGIVNEITGTIDQLIAAPAALFASLTRLATLPARIVANIKSKVDSYSNFITQLANSIPKSYAQAVQTVQTVQVMLAGAAVASTVGTISTRRAAVDSAAALEAMANTATLIFEQAESTAFVITSASTPPEYRPDGAVIAQLTEAVEVARAAIVERSYSLRAEYTRRIDAERTPLDLVAEFYGDQIADIDAVLDEFIRTNDLQNGEIIVIPAGREVIYYV
jgi:prophage DNA circulation protein